VIYGVLLLQWQEIDFNCWLDQKKLMQINIENEIYWFSYSLYNIYKEETALFSG